MNIKVVFLISAVLLAMTGVAVADDTQSTPGASNVTEMLQQRQQHQLRDQLVKEGRLDEVRKLDEASAIHARSQREQIYQEVNAQLATAHADKVPASECSTEEISTSAAIPAAQKSKLVSTARY